MRVWLVACLLAALCVSGRAQDATECASAVNAAKSQLEAHLTGSFAAEKASYDETISKWQAAYEALKSQYDELQATITHHTSSLAAEKDRTTSLAAQLEEAKKATASKAAKPHDVTDLLAALAKHGEKALHDAWAETKAIAKELQHGKTDRLAAVSVSAVQTLRGAGSCTVAFVKAELDEHVPEHIKQQVAAAHLKVLALWNQHVVEAAWAQPILKQLGALNNDMKKIVVKQLAKSPALAPLADPVTVQLVVVGAFALPLLLVLLIVLMALGGSAKKETQARPGGGKAKGKKSGKAPKA